MTELDEKRVREIVKEEIAGSKIPERLAVIETKLDANYNSLKNEMNLKFDNIKEQMRDDKKLIVGFFVLLLITVIGAALAK